jgi:hypothetical protein
MARLDEQQPVNGKDFEPLSDEPRKGDVLGLSGLEVSKASDLSTAYDSESTTQPPERTRLGDMLGLAEKSEEQT